jgi:hypothetical protein
LVRLVSGKLVKLIGEMNGWRLEGVLVDIRERMKRSGEQSGPLNE